MRVVSNASPLINLARIGRLALLHQQYGTLTIPAAVWDEVVVDGAGQPEIALTTVDHTPEENARARSSSSWRRMGS